MMKKILFTALLVPCLFIGFAQVLNENFAYNTGQLTSNGGGSNVSGGAWTLIGGTLQLDVVSGSLTFPGYASSGIGNRLRTYASSLSAEDSYTSFTPSNSNSIFYSLLINVSDTSRLLDSTSAGDYMIAFLPSTSTTSYVNRLTFRRGTGNTFNIGLRISSTGTTAVVWAPTNYTLGTTYLVASQYVFIAGAANDSGYLWVDPVLNGTIPTPTIAAVQTGSSTDASDIGRIAVRQSGATPNSFIDGIRVGTSWATSVLPVQLINFSASITNNQTVLDWATASERNNYGFEVEQSTDGEHFEKIGFVKGAGTSNKLNKYTFCHLYDANAYYRLKQVDFDGQFEYSNIVVVKNGEMHVSVNPNPFVNTLQITGKEHISNIEIMDIAGKTVLSKPVNNNQVDINTDQLQQGVYMIRINNGSSVITKRIVKH